MTTCRSDHQRPSHVAGRSFFPAHPLSLHRYDRDPVLHLHPMTVQNALTPDSPLYSSTCPLDPRKQMSGIPAVRELPSQRGILRQPDRGIPIYQTAGANTAVDPPTQHDPNTRTPSARLPHAPLQAAVPLLKRSRARPVPANRATTRQRTLTIPNSRSSAMNSSRPNHAHRRTRIPKPVIQPIQSP